MKKIRYLLSVFIVFFLALNVSVYAVDITFVGTYVDPTGSKRNSSNHSNYYDMYVGFAVKNYSGSGLTTDWVGTYANMEGDESENLDGNYYSYNVREALFTGLVEKEYISSTYTTEYKKSLGPGEEETRDYGREGHLGEIEDFDDGILKAIYDTLPSYSQEQEISVSLPDGTSTKVKVKSDVVSTGNLDRYIDLNFIANTTYINTKNKISDQTRLTNGEHTKYTIKFPLAKSIAMENDSGYRLYQNRALHHSAHNDVAALDLNQDIEILTAKGIERIVSKYEEVYNMSEAAVLKSLNDYGVRFSRSIATESYGQTIPTGVWGNLYGTSINFSPSPATFRSGSAAIYAVQYGSVFSFNNTGYQIGEELIDENGKTYMAKKTPKTEVSMLNNFDNIIRIPLAQKPLANIYIQYNRREYDKNKESYSSAIRTTEWGKKSNTTVKVNSSSIGYSSDDKYIGKASNEFDEHFSFEVTTTSSVQFNAKENLTITDSYGKTIKYKLNLSECKYVINANMDTAIKNLNGSTKKVTNPLNASLNSKDNLLLKLVYDQVNTENKILVQYRIMEYNRVDRNYKDPKRTYTNLKTTTVVDNTNGSTVQRASSVVNKSGARDVFDEEFRVDMSKYNMAFNSECVIDDRRYTLDLGNSYIAYNINLAELVSYVRDNRVTLKLSNPRSYTFTQNKETVGLILTYKEIFEEAEYNYIVLGNMDIKGKLQFISVTNTRDEDFIITDTLAQNVSNYNGVVTSQGRNNSVAGISKSSLLNRFKFVKSTFTEGSANDVTVNGSMGTVSYDFVPSGEYVSPYASDAYSYIVRAMTWKVNERVFDITKTIEARRSFVYVIRWAKEGPLPSFSYSKVNKDIFLYKSNTAAISTSKNISYYKDNNGSSISLTTKNTFRKYWEMNITYNDYYKCPYATGTYSADGDHEHDASCCRLTSESEFESGTKITVKINCQNCGNSNTYTYIIGGNNPYFILNIKGHHSNEDVKSGYCIDGKYHYSSYEATLTLNSASGARCSSCKGIVIGSGTTSGTAKAKNNAANGVSCNWSKYYAQAKNENGKLYNNGSSDEIEKRTSLYVGHYHDEKCFITSYDDKYMLLVDTANWNDEKYIIPKSKIDSNGKLPDRKNSGIGNTDLVVAGMKKAEFEKYFKDRFNSMSTVSLVSVRDYAKSKREYLGSYTLKYYTIENFKMYKIKDMIIYDKTGDDLGPEIFNGNKIVVPTSNNYENLFNTNNSNGLYSNAQRYESPNFLSVSWGIDPNFKNWGGGNSNEFSLDVPWNSTYQGKVAPYITSSAYIARDSTYYNSAMTIGGSDYVNKINRLSPNVSDGNSRAYGYSNGTYTGNSYTYNPYGSGVNVEGTFTYGQINKGASFTYYDNGTVKIYAYIGANGKSGGNYKDNLTNYRSFENSYVFLADDIGYDEALSLENLCQLSVDAVTDTEVALRVGVRYSISNFYNDYFRFTKNYGEDIEYLSHNANYKDDITLLDRNNNWLDKTDYSYTWDGGMNVTGYGQVKTTQQLFNQRSFLSCGAKLDYGEISKVDKRQNELKKLFDATNFKNKDYARKFANGNDTVVNNNSKTVRGYDGTYVTGEATKNGSSYEYTKNYISFTDNSKNTKVTDVYDWTLMNLPTSILYTAENGVGNGRRTFEYTIEYELVTSKPSGNNGILYKDSEEDSYTNYTNHGTTYWKKPDFSDYTWTTTELNEISYESSSTTTTAASGKSWIEPDSSKKHKVEVADHIHDTNFTWDDESEYDEYGEKIPDKIKNNKGYNRYMESLRFSDQTAYLNILSPVKIKEFWIETDDLINHIIAANDINNVLGKNTKFTLHFDTDVSHADVGYGINGEGVETEKYTSEFWLQFDFDLWCFGCKEHESSGYHEALDLIRIANNENYFVARTTGTYADPAVGKGENFIKIFAVAKNIPSSLKEYVLENDISTGQYLYEDEDYNTFSGRQTGRMNQVKGASRTSLYTDSSAKIKTTIDDAFHITYKEFASDSIFRIFGFEITDFKDILYKPVFRDGTVALKDNYYTGRFEWIYEIVKYGQLISNEALNSSSYTFDRHNNVVTKLLTLPVGPYSNLNTGYPYAPKLGYTFSFNVKTTGYIPSANTNNTRKVKITPSYYFISKDGKTYDSNVELYYKNAEGVYTKFSNSGYNIAFKPNDGYRNLRFIDDTDYSENLLSSELVYLNIDSTGGFELDNKCMTTSYTNFIQTWYGEFKLPNSTIAVKKNGNLNNPYTDGYIGVKFDIVCIDTESNQTVSYNQNDSDRYKGKDANGNDLSSNKLKDNTTEWDYEGNFGFDSKGKANKDIDFEYTLEKGKWKINSSVWNEIKSTVVLYDTDLRAEDDFE